MRTAIVLFNLGGPDFDYDVSGRPASCPKATGLMI